MEQQAQPVAIDFDILRQVLAPKLGAVTAQDVINLAVSLSKVKEQEGQLRNQAQTIKELELKLPKDETPQAVQPESVVANGAPH